MTEHRRPTYRRSRKRRSPWVLPAVVAGLVLAVVALVALAQPSSGGSGRVVGGSSATETVAATGSAEPTVVPEATPTPPAEEPDPEPEPEPQEPAKTGIVIAWQPSHQGDTGANGWKEYVICGDIVDRAIAKLPEFDHVKAWETEMGLTGSNNYRPAPTNKDAFDSELSQARSAGADVFVSIHNDGGAPSGILGEYLPGDALGKSFCSTMVDALVAGTGLKDRGMREVRLYSLEAPQNAAQYKCLVEIGDNAADRGFLEDPANRDRIAQALADGIRAASLVP